MMSSTRGHSHFVEPFFDENLDSYINSIACDNEEQNSSGQSRPSLTPGYQSNDHGLLSSSVQNQQNHDLDDLIMTLVESNCNGVPGSAENMVVDDDDAANNQGPNLSAELGDGDINNDAEPKLPGGSSSNAVNHSVGVMSSASAKGKEVLIDEGSSSSTLRPHTQARNTSVVGQAENNNVGNNNNNNIPVNPNNNNNNASSSHPIPATTPGNMHSVYFQPHPIMRNGFGFHANNAAHPNPHHPSTSTHNPERPQIIYSSPEMLFRSGQNLIPLNPLPPTGDIPVHYGFRSNQGLLSVNPNPNNPNFSGVYETQSVPSMMGFVPLALRTPPVLSPPVHPNFRASPSSAERAYQTYSSYPPPQHSFGLGRFAALDGAPPIHPMEYNSGYQHWPCASWTSHSWSDYGYGYDSGNNNGYRSHGYGPGLVHWNDFNYYYYYYYGCPYSADLLRDIQINPNSLGAMAGLYPIHDRRMTTQHTSQFVGAEIPSDRRRMYEHRNIVVNGRPVGNLPYQPIYGGPRHENNGFVVDRDRFGNLRLNSDELSYEELVSLSEWIGSVTTGLSEETIMALMKRKSYECVNTNPVPGDDTCCICRGEYETGEDIGVLNCGHEFHTECIKQWLVIKNNCPICKLKGLDA